MEVKSPAEMARRGNGIVATAEKNASDIARKVQELDMSTRIYSCDDLKVMGKDNMPSGVINLTITNNTAVTIPMPFGTPLSVSSEAPSIPLWDNIAQAQRWDNALALMEDNQGIGLPFYQELMKRILRKTLLVSHIDVITANDAQRATSPEFVQVPWNSYSDSNKAAMPYNGVFTEVTIAQILPKGVAMGEFFGLLYNIAAGQTVQFNIGVCAWDMPSYTFSK